MSVEKPLVCICKRFVSSVFRAASVANAEKTHWPNVQCLRRAQRYVQRIDEGKLLPQHEDTMSETATYEKERRSSRVFKRLRMQVSGKDKSGRKFREASETIVISAHGGLFYLMHEVKPEEMLVLANPLTQEEMESRVVYLGESCEKGQRVGVEFLSPSPHFWGVEFAQPDWHPSNPAPPSASA